MAMPGRTNARALILALCFGLLPACGPQSAGGGLAASQDGLATFTTLREAAEASGRFFGVSMQLSLMSKADYTAIAAREFDMVTPENVMLLDATEPSQNQFRFDAGDQMVTWAIQNGKRVHGYSLGWQTAGAPGWTASLTSSALWSAFQNHVQKVAAHYQGKIAYWDVVNEAYADDGSGNRRYSRLQAISNDWIEVAFQTARAADGTAKLCYNDYGIEDWAAAKTQGVYAMVKDFKARNVPIDCVAFESHFTGGASVPSSFQTTLSTFAALGVEVMLSELDVTSAKPAVYVSAVNACLSVAGCSGITVWGLRDKDSWRSSESPSLFDSNGDPKPAYDAVLAALNAATDTQPPTAPANLAWTNDGGTVTLTWTASSDDMGVASYHVYFGSFDIGTFSETSLALIGFKPGTPYSFTVKATDSAGNLSPASSSVTVLLPIPKDTTPPSKPTNLTATSVSTSTITLKWTASTDDVGVVLYQIFNQDALIATSLSPYATVPRVANNVWITIRAVDAAGNVSEPSPAYAPDCGIACAAPSSEP
jgi:endo-1,4-beta-xylanase